VHSRKKRRYQCRVCGKTFAGTKGTVFCRLRTAEDVVVIVVTLLSHVVPCKPLSRPLAWMSARC